MSPGVTPSMAGTLVLDILDAFREIVGPEVVARAIASLPDDLRGRVGAVTRLSWLAVADTTSLSDAVGRAAGRDVEQLVVDAARLATERSFNKIWRVMLRLTSDEAFIARAPKMYALSHDTGKLDARMVRPGAAELTLSGWPDVSDRHLRTLGVSIAKVVELTGRRGPAFEVRRSGEGGVYTLTWTP